MLSYRRLVARDTVDGGGSRGGRGARKASSTLLAKLSRQLRKPKMAVDVEGEFLALLFEEVVEEDAAASLRELNARFEDEGVATGSGVKLTDPGVETTGSNSGVWVPSCVPR